MKKVILSLLLAITFVNFLQATEKTEQLRKYRIDKIKQICKGTACLATSAFCFYLISKNIDDSFYLDARQVDTLHYVSSLPKYLLIEGFKLNPTIAQNICSTMWGIFGFKALEYAASNFLKLGNKKDQPLTTATT